MFRFFLLVIGGYVLYKLVRSIFLPESTNQKIGSRDRQKNPEYKNLNISDAEFEDINEDKNE